MASAFIKNHHMLQSQENKKKMKLEDDDQDHISKLPSCIISTTLSLMKTKEAVRTSILSSQWRHLCISPKNLILDADNILDEQYYSNIDICQMTDFERYIVQMKRTLVFIDTVNHYLSCLKEGNRIEKFKVFFTFRHDNRYENHLHRWIKFAIERQVEEIDLRLLEDNYFSAPINGDGLYVFPFNLILDNGSMSGFRLKCLRLAHCVFAPDRCNFSGFTILLTTLDLRNVDLVSAEHVQNLLCNCQNLEWLRLSECYNFDCLKIEHPFGQKLKYLNVSGCHQLKAIELQSANLENLEYKGYLVKFKFCKALRLRTVFLHLSNWRVLGGVGWPLLRFSIDHFPQLQTLLLGCCYCLKEGLVMPKRLPNLSHLSILEVTISELDLLRMATILKAFPNLQRLELHLRNNAYINEESRKTNRAPRCSHDKLKEAIITGISGYLSEIEIAIYVVKNATALEKMIIDPRPRVYLGNGKWHLPEACETWATSGSQKLREHLLPEVSPLALELIIL